MTTTNHPGTPNGASETPAVGAATSTTVTTALAPRPVLKVKVKLGQSGKRRYSRGLKDPQRMHRGWTTAATRLAEAAAVGLGDYRDRSEKSARKKRDGAIRDGMENWARAMGKAMKKASKVPGDLVKPINTKAMQRTARVMVRLLAFPFARR